MQQLVQHIFCKLLNLNKSGESEISLVLPNTNKKNNITRQTDYPFAQDLMNKGLECVPKLVRVLINNIMRVERTRYLQTGMCEQKEDRKGHADGSKPTTIKMGAERLPSPFHW